MVWLLLGGYCVLTSVLVCVGVMDACGRLRSRGGRGFYGCWGFKSVSKILLGMMVIRNILILLLL